MLLEKTAKEQSKKKHWWCANCTEIVELNMHGRCRACGSDAVDKVGQKGSRQAPVTIVMETSIAQGQGGSDDGLIA